MGFYLFSWLTQIWLLSSHFLLLWIVLRLLNCCAVHWWRLKCFFLCLQEMCSEWPPQDLQAPHHAGGFWELLLHFTILQGQGKSFTFTVCLSSPTVFQALTWRCSWESALKLAETCGSWVCSWSRGSSWSMTRVQVSSPASYSGALPYVHSGNLSSMCSVSMVWFSTGLWLFCFIIMF